jgi:uncharacterized membrane protein
MTMFIGWLFFCIAAAMFASIRRNRSAFGWFFVAFFFSPLVAFILLAILKERAPDLNLPEPEYDYGADAKLVLRILPAAIFVLVLIVVLSLVAANAGQQATSQQIIRDASGRTIGTATTDSAGAVKFRDAMGRTTGTVTTPRKQEQTK